MRDHEAKVYRAALSLSDKWLHLAIYLGYIAIEHGADPEAIFTLIRTGAKDEIDELLLGKMSATIGE